MSILDRRDGNDALGVNPPNANRHLTTHGSDWLWAVTAVFGITFLSFLAWTLMRYKAKTTHSTKSSSTAHDGPVDLPSNGHGNGTTHVAPLLYRERILHYLWTLAAFIGFISYFTMASDLGNTPIRQYLNNGGNGAQTRSIFYVRYIYYFTAWPLIVTANLLLAGVSWATIFFAIALQEIWVVSWLSGALVTTRYRCGYFAFGIFAYFVLAYLLLSWARSHAQRVGSGKSYTLLAATLVTLWLAYPIAWGLSEGGNRLSVTGEMVFYGILDLIAIPVYGSLFLAMSNKFPLSLFHFTQAGRGSGVESNGLGRTNVV